MPVHQTPSLEQHRLYALSLRLMAALMLSIMFAGVKWASERGVNIVEILFYRQFLALPIAIGGVMMGPGMAGFRTDRFGAHIGRCAVGMVGMVFNFGGFILLPLAEATAIGFTVPIFATILSVIFLGERPGFHRWGAVIVGFLGVLVIIGPGGHSGVNTAGVAVAIIAAIFASSVSLLLRRLGSTERPSTTVFYFSVLSLPPLGLAMLFYAQMHDPLTWAGLLVVGLAGGLAQFFMTSALKWGPVSLVLPMDYSTLLWSTALGWWLWTSWPGSSTWVGAAIIMASSLYIFWRERVRHRQSIGRGVTLS